MSDFKLQTTDTASTEGRAALDRANQGFGFVPNLIKVLANAPAAAHAYLDLDARLGESSLSAQEQQVVLLTASFENECDYCMAAHSTVAGMVGLAEADLSALREGRDLPTSRLNAIKEFTRSVVEKRGYVSEDDLDRFRGAGFDQSQILEVILGVTMKTLSNYTNHVARTPVDDAFQAQRWSPPVGAASA